MEFKGTEQQWKRDGNIIFADDYFQTHIAVLPDNYNEEITDANAILISKAPEMLGKITELIEKFYEGKQPTLAFINECEDLVKSATEI